MAATERRWDCVSVACCRANAPTGQAAFAEGLAVPRRDDGDGAASGIFTSKLCEEIASSSGAVDVDSVRASVAARRKNSVTMAATMRAVSVNTTHAVRLPDPRSAIAGGGVYRRALGLGLSGAGRAGRVTTNPPPRQAGVGHLPMNSMQVW